MPEQLGRLSPHPSVSKGVQRSVIISIIRCRAAAAPGIAKSQGDSEISGRTLSLCSIRLGSSLGILLYTCSNAVCSVQPYCRASSLLGSPLLLVLITGSTHSTIHARCIPRWRVKSRCGNHLDTSLALIEDVSRIRSGGTDYSYYSNTLYRIAVP